MSIVLSDSRDVREFVEAKQRKREPIHWHAKGVAEALCLPRTLDDFAALRIGLRDSVGFGRASERLDALESELFRRNGIKLARPRKVMQNTDCSISIWWNGVMVRCFPDGFVSLIGGTRGLAAKKITNELLDCLAQLQRVSQ